MKKLSNLKIKDNLLPLKQMHSPGKAYISLSSEQKKYIDKFNEDVLKGRIKFEMVSCLCSNDEFFLLASVDRYSMLQHTVICAKCGLILSNPRMTEEQYRIFYSSDRYRNIYESKKPLNRYESLYVLSTGQHIFDAVRKVKKLEKIKSAIEIGAGGGWNLIPFKKEGIIIKGCDYSPSLTSLGRRHGLDLFQGGIDDIEGSFDLIILEHVIEHFTDPIVSLKKIKKHLNPEGIIYIGVPNIEHFTMGQLQNAHTYYFTLQALKYYMSKSGLKLLYHEPVGKMHFAAIFTGNKNPLPISLNGNYEHMINIINKYRRNFFMIFITERYFYRLLSLGREIMGKLLKLIGLKGAAKNFFNFIKRLV